MLSIIELKKFLSSEFEGWEWSVPQDAAHGVLSTNQAFKVAKAESLNPVQAAATIVTQIQSVVSEEFEVKNIGPYVNIQVKDFSSVLNSDPKPEFEQVESKLVFEYMSPNAAKPLHAGHIRNADISEAILRCLKLKYANIVTESFWGDWGKQFGILLWAWYRLGEVGEQVVVMNDEEVVVGQELELEFIQKMVRVYVWGNQQMEGNESIEQEVKDILVRLEAGDEELLKIQKEFVSQSMVASRATLDTLNSTAPELNEGESTYVPKAKILAKFLDKNKLWMVEDKARYVDFDTLGLDQYGYTESEIKALGRCYFMSSNGYSTYALRDTAARIDWVKRFAPEKMITITAGEQQHHFKQFFAFLHYLSHQSAFVAEFGRELADNIRREHLKHITYGFLTLPGGKMSTRKGNFLTANDLIQQIIDESRQVLESKDGNTEQAQTVAIAALKWYDLARDASQDIVLNIPEILKFEGNTGVYQLYTIARLNSVLTKNEFQESDLEPQLTDDENEILGLLYAWPHVVEQVIDNYKPHLICTHLYSIATKINSWYAKNQITTESDEARKATMLVFVKTVKEYLEYGNNLLAIDVVESL